jgi:lysophospholipase L1-like esterase
VILAGTNDIAGNTGPETNEEIEGYLTSMCELARANGIRAVLASVTPVSAYHTAAGATPQTKTRPMERIRALNTWIESYAAAQGHVYLDYFSAMIDSQGLLQEELSSDDLHPNAKGYAIMAPLAEAAIAKALSYSLASSAETSVRSSTRPSAATASQHSASMNAATISAGNTTSTTPVVA